MTAALAPQRDASRKALSAAVGRLILLPALAGLVVLRVVLRVVVLVALRVVVLVALVVGRLVGVSRCPLGVLDPGDVVSGWLLAVAVFVLAAAILQVIPALAQSNPHRSSLHRFAHRAADR